MTNYEYAHLGMIYEFILATREIVHSDSISHECSTFQIMQASKLVYNKLGRLILYLIFILNVNKHMLSFQNVILNG